MGSAFAFQAQGRTGVRSFRYRHGYVAGRRRNANPRAKHGLGKRDWHFQRDVVAFAREATVRQNLDLDQRIPWAARARAGCSFASKAEGLSVHKARRNCHVKGAAIRQCQTFVGTRD